MPAKKFVIVVEVLVDTYALSVAIPLFNLTSFQSSNCIPPLKLLVVIYSALPSGLVTEYSFLV